jgi:hypothetical protein
LKTIFRKANMTTQENMTNQTTTTTAMALPGSKLPSGKRVKSAVRALLDECNRLQTEIQVLARLESQEAQLAQSLLSAQLLRLLEIAEKLQGEPLLAAI